MNESATYKPEDWKKDLSRLIRRRAIKKGLENSESLAGVKASTRGFEVGNAVQLRIDQLLEEEFSIDERKMQVAIELHKFLVSEGLGRNGFALITLGSAIHGGSLMRRLVGSEENSHTDLDLGIVADEMDNKFVEEVVKKANDFLSKEGEFELCWFMNPYRLHCSNLSSVEDAVKILEKAVGYLGLEEVLFLFFEPSIPPEVNQKNRNLLLEALTTIYQEDVKKWARIYKSLLSSWSEIHYIKPKHFGDETNGENKRDYLLMEQITNHSAEFMLEAMRNLLLSTKVEKSQPTFFGRIRSFLSGRT